MKEVNREITLFLDEKTQHGKSISSPQWIHSFNAISIKITSNVFGR
jgi:hypothetical protein